DSRGEDQIVRKRDVSLVAIEELGLALAAVPHLRIGDRNDSALRDLVFDLAPTGRRIWFDVLRDELAQHCERLLERWDLCRGCRALRDPRLEGVDLPQQAFERRGLRIIVVPVDVERRLDAVPREHAESRALD